MAIPNFQTLERKVEAAQMRGLFTKNSATMTAGTIGFYTTFTTAPDAGAAPGTTARVCGRATAGNLLADQRNDLDLNTAPLWMHDIQYQQPPSQARPVGPVMLMDRLADVSGLSGIVITAQTCNLVPTRYTTGENVMAAVQIYTAVGATATTLTIRYTNQAGVAGQVSKPVVFGGTTANAALQIIPIPLADGDTGIQSVQTVTVLASTATAGNFGITLYRPLAVMPTAAANGSPAYRSLLDGGAITEVDDNACLELFYTGLSATSTGIFVGQIGIVRGD